MQLESFCVIIDNEYFDIEIQYYRFKFYSWRCYKLYLYL